jgi:hypothetical protein
MHDHLNFGNVCAWWVPREQEDRERMNRMGLSLQHLLQYADGEDMLNTIVTGDVSWVRYYQPESKLASLQWKHPSSPSTKEIKVTNTPSAGKVMLTVFRNSQGVMLAHFQKHGDNANSTESLGCNS